MNMKIDDNDNIIYRNLMQNLLEPKYNDFAENWYKQVGSIIILTMIFNIFSTPIFVLCFHTIRIIKRLCDRSKI